MIKAVFFDIDDTLLSFSGYVKEALKNGFEKFGLRPYEDWMFDAFNKINNGLWHQIEDGTLTFEELKAIRFNMIFDAFGIDYEGPAFENYFRQYLNESAIPETGAMDLLQYMNGRYVMCTASNGPYNQQINRLKLGNMYDFFQFHFISEKIGASKPSKVFFETALRELNEGRPEPILPEEIMMVGDSLTSDMAGALSMGMRTLFYNSKFVPIPADLHLDYTVSSLDEIPGIL